MYVLIHNSGLFIKTQMQVKPLDMTEAKDISFQQCQEVQLFIMIFKMTLLQDWNALLYLKNVNNCFKDNWIQLIINKLIRHWAATLYKMLNLAMNQHLLGLWTLMVLLIITLMFRWKIILVFHHSEDWDRNV